MNKVPLALLSALFTCAVSTADANIVLNGSFEDSPLSASWLGTTGFERLGNNIYGNARDGSLRIVFNSGQATPNGSITQTVTVSPGSIMELSFWIQMEGTDMGSQLGIAASIIENNQVTHSLACLPKAEGKLFKNWYKYQLSFTPVSATITIRFSDVSTSSDSQDIALDDVVLEPRWTYAVNESNQATVRSYNGPAGHVTIPAAIDGYSVRGLVGAYYGSIFGATRAEPNTNITSVTIPDSVTSIGEYAFADTHELTSIVIPNSVTNIGGAAFVTCPKLVSVTLGDNVSAIGSYAFKECSALSTIRIPTSLETIGEFAFSDCPALTNTVFLGNAPSIVGAGDVFYFSPANVVYRLPAATGWSETFGGSPVLIPNASAIFGSPQMFGLFTKSEYDANRTSGRTDVTTNPSAFNLFTQSQFNNNRAAGQSDVINNPMSYGLYTSNSIVDLRMGGLMIQREGTNAVVSFQPQTTTDLTLPFTNNGTPITNTIPMPGNKGFIRINAKP